MEVILRFKYIHKCFKEFTDIPEIYLYPLIFTFLPFIFSAIFLISLIVTKKIKFKQIFQNYCYCFFVSIFLLQSSIYNSLLEVFQCQSIDSHYYIGKYLLESCESDNYKRWLWYLIIPSCGFYMILIPGVLFGFMLKKYGKLDSQQVRKYIGISLQGLAGSKFYWLVFLFFLSQFILLGRSFLHI